MRKTNFYELATAVCNRAGVACTSIEILTTWEQKFTESDNFRNNAVFHIGNKQILKIFSTDAEKRFQVEWAALETLSSQTTIPAPRLVAANEQTDLPPYVIMTEVCGETLQNIWDNLSRAELLTAAFEIGRLTSALHQLPTARLAQAEALVGGREGYIREMEEKRREDIEAAEWLTIGQRKTLLDFLLGEARTFVDGPKAAGQPVFTHSDFSHAHVYLLRKNRQVPVSGFIDWGEAMLGPAEWDTTFHWFWTFSGDKEAMRECLRGYFGDGRLPEQFARRCLSVHLYSYSMRELWYSHKESFSKTDDIVEKIIGFFFPEEAFGPPD